MGFSGELHEELRFLNTQGWDFKRAYEGILDFDDWLKRDLIPILADYDHFQTYLELGIVYGYGRDREQRPIIVFEMRRWIDSGISPQELLSTIDFLTGYTIFNA